MNINLVFACLQVFVDTFVQEKGWEGLGGIGVGRFINSEVVLAI